MKYVVLSLRVFAARWASGREQEPKSKKSNGKRNSNMGEALDPVHIRDEACDEWEKGWICWSVSRDLNAYY